MSDALIDLCSFWRRTPIVAVQRIPDESLRSAIVLPFRAQEMTLDPPPVPIFCEIRSTWFEPRRILYDVQGAQCAGPGAGRAMPAGALFF